MELSRSERIRLMVFLFAGTFLLVASILLLIGLNILDKKNRYTVYFEDSVSGLEVSSPVRYQGLRVGLVESMSISRTSTAVVVVLAIDETVTLHQGTKAILDLSGITGLKTVNLKPGDPRRPRIPSGSVLPTGESMFDRITGRFDEVAEKVEMITNRLARWTSDENRLRFEALLDSSNSLAQDLDKFLVDTREPAVLALLEFERSGASFRNTADEATTTLKTLRGDVKAALTSVKNTSNEMTRVLEAVDSDEVQKSVSALKSSLVKIDQRVSKAELGQAIQSVSSSLKGLTELMQEVDLTVRAGREDFVLSLKHIRQATEDLREFSRIIAQDPSVLLRGAQTRD